MNKLNIDFKGLLPYIVAAFTAVYGEDNFENLVDAVNKVDYLSRNGVIPKIEKAPEDDIVVEYLEQVDRVKQIYNDIDEYYNEHFGELMDVNKAKIMLYL